MMNILIDTQIFIWWHEQPSRLSASAFALCSDSANTLFLSVVSAWEMQIKVQTGKLQLRRKYTDSIARQQQTNNLQLLPVTLAHVLALDALPLHHRDPFDRLLIAQANAQNFALLSADSQFTSYHVNLLS